MSEGLEDILARTCASEFWKELEQIERRLRIVKSLDASVSYRLRNLEMQKIGKNPISAAHWDQYITLN